jgi:hypothetical protein
MLDDGVNPDASAGDILFTRGIIFPDSSQFHVEFKYWLNGQFECNSVANRSFELDDVNYSVGNPLIRPINYWDYCSDAVGVPESPRPPQPSFAVLNQNHPNPFNPVTRISFELRTGGETKLRIFDAAGRRVRTLMTGNLDPGTYVAVWDGTDDGGRTVGSGVYFYELSQAGRKTARRMVVMQ